jgi:tetratricopeptide (TPR) repeat protein
MKKLLFTAVIFIFALPVLADDKWTKMEFPNFTVTGTAGDNRLKEVGNKLEQFRQTLGVLLPKTKLNSSIPTVVYVFESLDNLQTYLPKSNKGKLVGGFFIPSAERNYIALSVEDLGYNVDEVIYHEYFHYVTGRNLRNVPLWLNEGLAQYYSTFRLSKDKIKIIVGSPLGERVLDLRRRPLIPLEKLFAVNYKSPEYNERIKTGIFYAESWSLVHYLIQGNAGQRQTQFDSFISLLENQVSPKEAFEKSFQTDYAKMEKELSKYLTQFAFPGVEYTLNRKISTDDNIKTSKLSEAETKIKQADLLILMERYDVAEKRLNESFKTDDKLAEANRLLGKIRSIQKNYTEARAYFEKAAMLEPDDYLNNYYFAGFLNAENKTDEAIKLYLQAIKLNPNLAGIYASLGKVYYGLYRDAEAIEVYNQAAKLDSEDSVYPLALAQLFLRNGNNFQAAVRAKYFIKLEGWGNASAPYAALIMYFGYQREGSADKAAEILKLATEKVDKSEWIYSIYRYLNKEINENDLIVSAANNKDKLTEAHCYVGLNKLLAGKKDEAAVNFKWVAESGNKSFVEYGYAVKELGRLDLAPKLIAE